VFFFCQPMNCIVRSLRLRQPHARFAHGHGSEIPIAPYRKAMVPPNRPLAFTLGGMCILLAVGLTTGFFMWDPLPHNMPEHENDRHPAKTYTKVQGWAGPKDN